MPRSPRIGASRLRAAALLTAALVVTGACGDDGSGTEAAPTRSPTATQPPQATPAPSPSPSPSPRYAAVPERSRDAVDGPLDPRPFEDADTLAQQLTAAERAIHDEDTPGAELEAWAWTQQQAYRDLVEHPEWHEDVLAVLPEELHTTFERNVHANEELRELTTPRESLPDWRIVSPPPADELLSHYRSAGEEFDVGWEYLAAIHLSESRMGRIRGASVAGARGPMQFLPSTWEAYGEGDIDDPHDAIRAAARYLVAHGAPDDMRRALFAYNHSEHYVNAVSAHAAVMRDDPASYRGYYHWRVYYRMVDGEVILPEGWEADSA